MRFAQATSLKAVRPRHALGAMLIVVGTACVRSVPAPDPSPAAAAQARIQDADTASASRERARALLTAALRATGVADTSGSPAAFEITLEVRPRRANWAQARRWTDTVPLATPTRLAYLADVQGRRAMFELHSPAPGGIWFRYLTRYDTTGTQQVDLLRWRLGDDLVRGSVPAARAAMASIERLVPHGAIRQALRADESLRMAGERVVDGERRTLVSYVDASSTQPVTIELDAGTGLPAAVATGGGNMIEFRDYRAAGGVLVPFHRVQWTNGQPTADLHVTALNLRPAIDDARFELPPGYADAPPPGAPRAVRLAAGVYRLDGMPGGYHSVFVVGDSGVAILEAPHSTQFTDAAIGVIAGVAPGAPITRVFVTHHHSDHVAGLGPYVARGASIVVAAELEEAIRRQLPDSLRARASFIPVTGRRTFGSGETRIESHPVPNTHADGNLAYWLPAPRILFQGDLFYIPERGDVPPAFPVTDALASVIREAGLRPALIVGVHGRSGTLAELEQSLAIRR